MFKYFLSNNNEEIGIFLPHSNKIHDRYAQLFDQKKLPATCEKWAKLMYLFHTSNFDHFWDIRYIKVGYLKKKNQKYDKSWYTTFQIISLRKMRCILSRIECISFPYLFLNLYLLWFLRYELLKSVTVGLVCVGSLF